MPLKQVLVLSIIIVCMLFTFSHTNVSSTGISDNGPYIVCGTFQANCSKEQAENKVKVFFKQLKVTENLRAEITGQGVRWVRPESRNVWKQVPWILAKRGTSYARSKVSFSKTCYSAPFWSIAVRMISVVLGMLLYQTVIFHKQIRLHVCIRVRRRNFINQRF